MAQHIGKEAALRGIKHWQAEKNAALAQIESGKFPEYDDNCRAYIRECSEYIAKLAAAAGLN